MSRARRGVGRLHPTPWLWRSPVTTRSWTPRSRGTGVCVRSSKARATASWVRSARASDAVAAALDAQLRVRSRAVALRGDAARAHGDPHRRGAATRRRQLLRPDRHSLRPHPRHRVRRPGAGVGLRRRALSGTGCPTGASLVDLGVHRLKDLGRPEHVWQLAHHESGRRAPAAALARRVPTQPAGAAHAADRPAGRCRRCRCDGSPTSGW